MLDPSVEDVMSLAEAAKLKVLPTWRGGKRPTVQTLIRWCEVGFRGIVLEHVRFGGTLCTSREAIIRFAERCTRPHLSKEPAAPSRRRRSHSRADALLRSQGM